MFLLRERNLNETLNFTQKNLVTVCEANAPFMSFLRSSAFFPRRRRNVKNAVIDGSHETMMSFLGCHEKVIMYFHFKLEVKSSNCQIESLSLSVFGINILCWIVSDSLKYRPQAVLKKTK